VSGYCSEGQVFGVYRTFLVPIRHKIAAKSGGKSKRAAPKAAPLNEILK